MRKIILTQIPLRCSLTPLDMGSVFKLYGNSVRILLRFLGPPLRQETLPFFGFTIEFKCIEQINEIKWFQNRRGLAGGKY